MKNSPARGELWIVNLEPGFGKEIHKKRPALIISPKIVNENTPHVIIVPLSSLVPEVVNSDMILLKKQKGLNKTSVILPIFIRSIDQERLMKKIGRVSSQKLIEVETMLKLIIGFEE